VSNRILCVLLSIVHKKYIIDIKKDGLYKKATCLFQYAKISIINTNYLREHELYIMLRSFNLLYLFLHMYAQIYNTVSFVSLFAYINKKIIEYERAQITDALMHSISPSFWHTNIARFYI